MPAPQMTTDEFLLYVADFPGLDSQHKQRLKDFLTHCDMVKFARYGPDAQEMEKSFLSARKLIEETAHARTEAPV